MVRPLQHRRSHLSYEDLDFFVTPLIYLALPYDTEKQLVAYPQNCCQYPQGPPL